MILCLLVVYWHFLSDRSDLPFWCLFSVVLFICLSSTLQLFAVASTTLVPLCFCELHTFSWVLYCMTSSIYLFLLSALPFSLSSAVSMPVSPFPFVSSPRPFYSRCFCPLVFSFFGCLNSWTSRPTILAFVSTVWFAMCHCLNRLYLWLHKRWWSMWGPCFNFVKHLFYCVFQVFSSCYF